MSTSKKAIQDKVSAAHRLIHAQTRTKGFSRFIQELLVELCRIDTTPSPNIARMRTAEAACFTILERELSNLDFRGATNSLRREPVSPGIQNSPHFSLLHFTKTPARPTGLKPEEAYQDRSNLLCHLAAGQGKTGKSVALNAHLDVVLPFIAPKARNGIVFGRGACDDKGPVVSIVGALKMLSTVLSKMGLELNQDVLAMFVVEEETGGNGSLSLALDRELKKSYDSVLVCECTDLKLHPANRGAVWYRAELQAPAGSSLLELAAAVVLELENEGNAIRAESRHALFPQRPVQTCHGILGPFGEHPSRICGKVVFNVHLERKPTPAMGRLLQDCLDAGLAQYTGIYGDKTKVTDPGTGQPMVKEHYRLRSTGQGFEVTVNGAAGHMGSVRERDGAITKTAYLVRSLLLSRNRLEKAAGRSMKLELAQPPYSASGDRNSLILEGGQGFVPTHTIEEVMQRLRSAASRAARAFLRPADATPTPEEAVRLTYEKLHNVAFDGDPESASMRNAKAAAKACGLWKGEPILGWTVSCDARLFASEYPGMDVLTFGPGKLAFAHSDHEQIALEDIRKAVEFLCLFLLLQTATL